MCFPLSVKSCVSLYVLLSLGVESSSSSSPGSGERKQLQRARALQTDSHGFEPLPGNFCCVTPGKRFHSLSLFSHLQNGSGVACPAGGRRIREVMPENTCSEAGTVKRAKLSYGASTLSGSCTEKLVPPPFSVLAKWMTKTVNVPIELPWPIPGPRGWKWCEFTPTQPRWFA